MSLPFYSLKCDGCNFEQVFSYDTRYQFENLYGDECQPSLDQAWCKDCNSLVTTANPLTENSILEEVTSLNKRIKEESEKTQSLFGLFGKKPNEELISKWKTEISNLKMAVSFFKFREMKTVCLTCGGDHIIPTRIHDVDKAENFAIGIKHSCDGNILASYGGRYSFVTDSLPIVKYDIDGKIIFDSREKNIASSKNENRSIEFTPSSLDEIRELAKIVSIESVVEEGVYSGFLILPNENDLSKLDGIREKSEALSAFVEIIKKRLSDNDFDDLLDHRIYEQYSLPSMEADNRKSTAKRVVVGSNQTLLFKW